MDNHTSALLNNGVSIPMLGLGVFRAQDGEECANAVEAALSCGYLHIDTAAVYGNEGSVGEGLRRSGVPRQEIFLTTKLWNEDQRAGRQRQAFEESLKRLGTEYVDLYLIHWPVKEKYAESWRVLEELYAEGRVRAIGVSNFLEHHLDDLLSTAKVVPAVNQVECHPRFSQEPLRAYCEKLSIAFEAWSPLGGSGAGSLVNNSELTAIGATYGKSAAQVMIRWELQRGIITIPKSSHPQRIQANADVFDFELSATDMAAIHAMNRNERVGSHPDTFTF